MSKLFERYVEFGNPVHGENQRVALDTFSHYLADADWLPENPHLAGYQDPLHVGALAVVLDGVANAPPLLTDAIAAIAQNQHPQDEISELDAAAMLRGANLDVRFVRREKARRTPDLQIAVEATTIDAEVVSARWRGKNSALNQALAALVERIGLRADADVLIYLYGEVPEGASDLIAQTAQQLPAGEVAEELKRWRVVAIPPTGADAPDTDAYAPEGWSVPSLWVARMEIGPEPTKRLSVGSMPPEDSYFGPVLRKAQRPQRSSNENPFLIVYNTSNLLGLPDAVERLRPELDLAFTTWSDVSGVLLFDERFAASYKGTWRAALVPNPHADIPLPAAFVDACGEGITEILSPDPLLPVELHTG